MQHLSIYLEDWQQAVLMELARARGVTAKTMAESLLSEQLAERRDESLYSLLVSGGSASCIGSSQENLSADTIEQRLKQLFEE